MFSGFGWTLTPSPPSQLAKNCCRHLFKCLTCLLLSITVCESRRFFGMFYFWRLHTLPVFLCLALLVLPSFLFIIHFSSLTILIRGSLLEAWMVSVGFSVCLVLQMPSHLAGPLVVLGSGPGMQGMVQWTIRRKFPAAQLKLRNNSVMCNNWKKKWKGWRQRVGWNRMPGQTEV